MWLPYLVFSCNLLCVICLKKNFSAKESGRFVRKLESLTADSAHKHLTCSEGTVVGLKFLDDDNKH